MSALPLPRRGLLPAIAVIAVVLIVALGWWSGATGDGPAADPTTSSTTSASTSPASTSPASSGPATGDVDPESGLAWVEVVALPPEAARTLSLIDRGGPFPYDRDGSTFRNAERLLPAEASGYYREYTVRTPGEDDRGARRIVVGRGGEHYWTADHYASFSRIRR